MTAILLTGMSGAGKSTVLVELACRGWSTIDTDNPEWIIHAGDDAALPGERLWNEPLIGRVLAAPRAAPLAIAGTVQNQGVFRGRFDAIVLLTAPIETMLERVASRTTNPFGRLDAEREAIRRDHADVEPLLRASATHIIDTTRPLVEVIDAIARIADDPRSGAV